VQSECVDFDDWIRLKPPASLCIFHPSPVSHHRDYTAQIPPPVSGRSFPPRTLAVGREAFAWKKRMKEVGFVTEHDLMNLAR